MVSTGCVLIVDDEAGAREAMREAVEMAGCSAMVASNGAEALKLLEEHRPCLVVLDLLMPVMTGPETLEAILKDPSLATIPIVFATSAPDRAPLGTAVLTKPVDLQALWSCIRHACQCGADFG